jgi:1-acyl-sn-glycerol-3-phosphate acyltransferase
MKPAFCFFARKVLKPIFSPHIEEIKGLENVPKDTNFILAANHQSNLDHFFVPFPLEDRLEKVHFIGKRDNILEFLVASFFYWIAETIPVNRKAKDKRKVLEKAVETLKKGGIIIIYPEGTRNRKKEILEGKTGAAEMAIRSGVPIVPVALIYKNQEPRRLPLRIKVGKPLYFKQEMDYENLREATDKMMKEIYLLSERSVFNQ